jgi:hypothetical protein
MDDFYMLSRLLGTPIPELESFEEDSELRKALSTSGAAEWIPTGLSSELTRMIRLELKVAALFGRFNMPTNPYKLPSITAGFAPKLVAEAGTPTASDITASGITFDAIKLMVHGVHNYETEEDSIIPILPVIREELVYALADALEEAIINGDDSGTHQDTDTEAGSAELVAKAFKGLRKSALNASLANCKVDASTTFDDADLRAGRKAMGKHGVNPNELAYIASIAGFFRMLSFANIMTYDKIGDKATLLNGQLAAFDGSPVIVSEKARDDVDNTGVNGASGNDFTTLLIVKTGNKWLIGDRRDVLVEADKNIVTQQDTLVASQRLDFHTPYAVTEKLVCAVYNIGN